MEFEFYIKQKDSYVKKLVTTEPNVGHSWLASLRMNIEQELDKVREDILSYSDDEKDIFIKKPYHPDKNIQNKLNTLVKIRKTNLVTRDVINEILGGTEFIFCRCGHKMYRTPVDVSYKRMGTGFIITEDKVPHSIRYIYMCEHCVDAVSESSYIHEQQMIKLRNDLLDKGYNWVPNNLGIWYKFNDGKPMNKSPEMRDDLHECDHAWERKFEKVFIGTNLFMKITEECKKCNKVVTIK